MRKLDAGLIFYITGDDNCWWCRNKVCITLAGGSKNYKSLLNSFKGPSFKRPSFNLILAGSFRNKCAEVELNEINKIIRPLLIWIRKQK